MVLKMSENADFLAVIDRIEADIDKADLEQAERKRMVNKLCEYAGLPPRHLDFGSTDRGAESPGAANRNIRPDQFHGKPLSTAVREYLELRGNSNAGGLGAASDDEIFGALRAGGFKFEGKSEENSLRGLRISLAKNSIAFRKLPNGTFGLAIWYGGKPGIERRKLRLRPDVEVESGATDDAEGAAETETADTPPEVSAA